MKILYFSSSVLPSDSANSVHVMRMAHAFSDLGYEITLVGSGGRPQDGYNVFQYYGVEPTFSLELVGRANLWKLGSMIYGMRSATLVNKIAPDLLYGRCPHSLALSCVIADIPFIYEAHNIPRNTARKSIEKFLFRSKKFQRLVVISSALKKDYLLQFPELKSTQIVVAHDGADAGALMGWSRRSGGYEEFDSGAFRAGYVGSLVRGKGAEIIPNLARLRPQYEFHVIGGNQEQVSALEERAPDNIVLHGRIAPSEVRGRMRGFDVLLLPAQYRVATARGGDIALYTSPLKMFEYMAVGRPIVASDLPVLGEVLEHNRNALLASAEDAEEWVVMLDKLAKNRCLRERLAAQALFDLNAHYTWKSRAKKVLDGLESIVGSGG